MMLTHARQEEIRDEVIAALNWMGGHFCQALVELQTAAEADYAFGLWPYATRTTPLRVVFGRPIDWVAYDDRSKQGAAAGVHRGRR